MRVITVRLALFKQRKHHNKELHQCLLHASESVLSVQRPYPRGDNSKKITQKIPSGS